MNLNPQRNYSVDFLRTLAIIFIVLLNHLTSYLFNFYDLHSIEIPADFSIIGHLMRYYGIGIFVFISGGLLSSGNSNKKGLQALHSFLIKRFLRIFPLYWVALVLFIGLFIFAMGKDLVFINFITHFLRIIIFTIVCLLLIVCSYWIQLLYNRYNRSITLIENKQRIK